MSTNKILVTGANGQLGSAVQEVFASADCELIPLGRADLDITDHEQVKKVFTSQRPEIIINCAAYNNVEEAEENPSDAFAQNAIGPYWLAKEAKSIGAILVHVSTDYVFDGEKKEYIETDCPNPLSVYGLSKLAGERLVLMVNQDNFVIRTSWLFGSSKESKGRNFVKTMLTLAKADSMIRVVSDQFGCPTYALDLARKMRELLDIGARGGIYHIANGGSCSRYEFAEKIFELAGVDAKIISITTGESGTKARRPASSALKNKRLADLNLMPMRHWSEALSDYLKKNSF